MMKMRTDSRGSPIRRTFLGNLDHYIEGKMIMDRKSSYKESHLNVGNRNKFANNG